MAMNQQETFNWLVEENRRLEARASAAEAARDEAQRDLKAERLSNAGMMLAASERSRSAVVAEAEGLRCKLLAAEAETSRLRERINALRYAHRCVIEDCEQIESAIRVAREALSKDSDAVAALLAPGKETNDAE